MAKVRGSEGLDRDGPIPYGLKLNELGKWIIPEDEARVISEMAALRNRGVSYLAIANRLNAQGAPSPQGCEKWSGAVVMSVLNNPADRSSHGDSPAKK